MFLAYFNMALRKATIANVVANKAGCEKYRK